jgi:drug/metabolite transporter (DMT)-like permease
MDQFDGVSRHEEHARAHNTVSVKEAAPAQRDVLPRSLYSMLAALTIIWGFNWTVMKVVITEVPPWFFRSLCFLSAFFGLLAIAHAMRLPVRVPQGQWGRLALIAFFTVSLQNFFLMLALPLLPSGRVVILQYTMPMWSVLLSRMILGEALTARRLVGVAFGLAGVGVLLSKDMARMDGGFIGVVFMLCSALVWGVGTVLQKRLPVDLPIASFTGWMGLLGGLPIFLLALVYDRQAVMALQGVTLWPALGVLYNMFLVFIFGWWAWTKIVDRAPAGVAGLSSLAIPVVGVFSGMLFLGEVPAWQDYAALIFVSAAIATVIIPER